MLSFTIIGAGAAGNKAAIMLMESGYNNKKVYLINSTNRDIPTEYHDKVILFGQSANRLGGCGKERNIGREMLMADLRSNAVDLDQMVNDEDQAIIIVGSTEGGSGSSSIPIMAKYFKEVYGKNVIIIPFFGFNDDARGMQNSIELCQELADTYTVAGISNEKFMKDGMTRFDAETAANKYFCDLVKILSGQIIRPGPQVMDDTDLYKVVTTPGYLMAGTINMQRPKSPDDYKRIIMNGIRDHGFVDPGKQPGAKRIAIAYDVPDADANVDFGGQVVKDFFGEPFELFTNLSINEDGIYQVSYIASGMRMPAEEVENIYNEFMNRTQSINQSRDSFFDKIGNLSSGTTQGFDMLADTKQRPAAAAKADFFAAFQRRAAEMRKEQQAQQPSTPIDPSEY